MVYGFNVRSHQLANGNTTSERPLRYKDKIYFGTLAGGYAYLVEVNITGNIRTLRLFPTSYDPTYGEDDIHCTPALEWIEEGKKILVVGGAHGAFTPLKWAVVDVESWSIVANGDFGDVDLTYPVLFRTSDGKISLFIARQDESVGYRRAYWYEFDPSTNTWIDHGYITIREKCCYRPKYGGIDIDNGRYILALEQPGAIYTAIEFDPDTKKFYDLQGNELSIPFDHTAYTLTFRVKILVKDNYAYIFEYNEDTKELYIKKYTRDQTLVSSKLVASSANGLNTIYMQDPGYTSWDFIYYDNKIFVVYRNNNNNLAIGILDPDTLDISVVKEISIDTPPAWIWTGAHYEPAIIFNNITDTTGNTQVTVELSSDHVTYVVFIDKDHLSGWKYRKKHDIVGSSQEVDNYAVRFKVHYGDGTDSGEDVYLNGKCRADFGDILFTADDGVTVLDHWIEEHVDGDYAIVWVKIPHIPASPDKVSIYIYYGNPEATYPYGNDQDRMDKVFIFADHFYGDSLDSNKWEVGAGTSTVSNSELVLSGDGNNVYTKQSFNRNIAIHSKAKLDTDARYNGFDVFFLGTTDVARNAGTGYLLAVQSDYYSPRERLIKIVNGTGTGLQDGGNESTLEYHRREIRISDSKVTVLVDDTQIIDVEDSEISSGVIKLSVYGTTGNRYCDYIFVRKYIDPEPSHDTWYSEEVFVATFSIVSYPTTVSGKPNETKILTITVENQEYEEGTVQVRIKDHNNNVVASQQQSISAGQSYTFNISITLPSQSGTYTWTIEAYNTDIGSVDDSKTFTVQVSSTITTTTKKKSEFPWWILLLIGIGAVMYLSGKEKKK